MFKRNFHPKWLKKVDRAFESPYEIGKLNQVGTNQDVLLFIHTTRRIKKKMAKLLLHLAGNLSYGCLKKSTIAAHLRAAALSSSQDFFSKGHST